MLKKCKSPLHKPFDKIPDRAVAAGMGRDVIRNVPDGFCRVCRTADDTALRLDGCHAGEVVDIIADVRHGLQRFFTSDDGYELLQLVADALVNLGDPQLAASVHDDIRGAPCDDHRNDAGRHQDIMDAAAVLDVEGLHELAGVRYIDLPVRERAVN